MIVRKDIQQFLNTIPEGITLVAATKYVDALEIKKLINFGITNFGENRVDAFLLKYEALKEEKVNWHFIGHLQRNKAKKVLDKIDCLHSLDSLELAEIIQKERTEPLDCFIEVAVNHEENKDGVDLDKLDDFVLALAKYDKVHVVGLMMMGVKGSDNEDLFKQFKTLTDLRNGLNNKYHLNLQCLSMGMSEDYPIAIKAGATHIRLGRILFE